MICCQNTTTAIFFSSVHDIPTSVWETLQCKQNTYFDRHFLSAIEKNHPKITFSYIVLVDKNKKPIALALIQIIDFHLNALQSDYETLKKIGKKLRILKENKALKLLVAGNTFVSGEHGLFIKENEDKKAVVQQLSKALQHFAETHKKENKNIDAFLIKDFENESLPSTSNLKSAQYNPFSVEPNMVLKIDENWRSLDAYLEAMKTKFRVKAKKAYQQSAPLKIEEVTLETIESKLTEMTLLYKKVAENSNFNLGDFNLETYKDFKASFGEKYILKTFYLEDKLVGFMSGILTKNSVDAHFVGIDYTQNRTHAIYQRMLYTYIEIAISKKVKLVNFGRTASEIKSSVGAVPQDLTMYLKHKKTITNTLLKLFLQRIQPTPFQQKFPFKKETIHEK